MRPVEHSAEADARDCATLYRVLKRVSTDERRSAEEREQIEALLEDLIVLLVRTRRRGAGLNDEIAAMAKARAAGKNGKPWARAARGGAEGEGGG